MPKPPAASRSLTRQTTGLWGSPGSNPSRRPLALTEATAAIQSSTGAITTYRRHSKPALGPPAASLDDLEAPFGGSAA
jgi:hypothetical protein